jgi:monoamine oxidase/SAM-dependent methyltransferase
MTRIAIVGGGPGGLLTAYLLEQYCADLCELTVFEASGRVGGKVLTRRFDAVPVLYEAGVAELYDYSHFGPDPVKQLVKQLGLSTVRMSGPAVILGDAILNNDRDIRSHFGPATLKALRDFHARCRELCTPEDYYEGHWQDDNGHPWADKTFRDVLDEIPDETARKYVEVACRSDTATEPHLTSALNGLKNVLMDDSRYLRLYSIEGGIERLIEGLRAKVQAPIVLDTFVTKVGRNADGTYRLTTQHEGRTEQRDFDLVVFALPNYWLGRVEWDGRELRLWMQKHLGHYDRPAHYLRISVLFQQPFWRQHVSGSYFMSDAFGGCCVYDEGARHECEPYGVLGWLLAGNDAMALNNLSDDDLVTLALDSLPAPLASGRKLFLEGKVHRWVGSINALPGGNPVHQTRDRHLPAREHPGLYVLGDYLFDSTINGVYDSADFVTDMILTELRRKHYTQPAVVHAHTNGHANGNGHSNGHSNGHANGHSNGHSNGSGQHLALANGHLDPVYHDRYDGERSYEESYLDYFNLDWTLQLIQAVWDAAPPYRLLDCGSASGLTLAEFAKAGVEAWGIENSPYSHANTPAKWKKRNFLGDVRKLPFPDGHFDFVYDTCLCYVPPEDIDQAVRELLRVTKRGIFFGGVTSDMTKEVIEDYNLFKGVRSLFTLWEWSEVFLRNGWRITVSDRKVLDTIWQIESEIDEDDWYWYPDAESMRYCFYSNPDASRLRLSTPKQSGRKRVVKG